MIGKISFQGPHNVSKNISIKEALCVFAEKVTLKTTQLTPGEPEDQLRGPFENLMADVATVLGWNVVCTGETPLPGRPDYAVHLNQLLAGYVELKAPGAGLEPATKWLTATRSTN